MRTQHLFPLCLLCLSLLTMASCERRELNRDYEDGASFHIALDWSALGDAEQPLYVKALFFPVTGGAAVERYVEPQGQDVKVPPGDYRVIIYTWRTNADAQTVQFRGNTYEGFEAYTQEKELELTVSRAATSIAVVPQPDAVYAWHSSEAVEISYTKGVRTRATTSHTLKAVMRSMVQEYVFDIYVRNASDIQSLYAVLTHVNASKPLSGGNATSDPYGLLVQSLFRMSQEGDITAYRCRARTFGFQNTAKSFILNITNKSGGGQQEVVDITQDIDGRVEGVIPSELPIVIAPKENPVVVKPGGGGGGGSGGFVPPTLGDWDQKDEDINL